MSIKVREAKDEYIIKVEGLQEGEGMLTDGVESEEQFISLFVRSVLLESAVE